MGKVVRFVNSTASAISDGSGMSMGRKKSWPVDFISRSVIETASVICVDIPRLCSPVQTSLLGLKDPRGRPSLRDGGFVIGGGIAFLNGRIDARAV